MYGIILDIDPQELSMFYSYTEQQAYVEISEILAPLGFEKLSEKIYLSSSDNMADLFVAVSALKQKSWFSSAVRKIQSFHIDHLSDLTKFVRS